MFKSIKKVKEQFLWKPEITGARVEGQGARRIVVCGMGGSNIASGFLEMLRPDLEVVAHRTYGLPANVKKDDLVIISSYSGNTEESLDSLQKAMSGGFYVVAITVGGKLLELVKKQDIPYIQLPTSNIQPRMALGYSLLAMLKAIGDEENLQKAKEFAKNFSPENFEEKGKGLAEKLQGQIPIIYSSWNNKAIAYVWKLKFTETAKVPAFFNIFPELNHNEMVGFMTANTSNQLYTKFYFVFLKDSQDHHQVQKRMEITKTMLKEKGFAVDVFDLENDVFKKIFNSLAIADWASHYLAQNSGFDPEDSLVIEEFKNKIT